MLICTKVMAFRAPRQKFNNDTGNVTEIHTTQNGFHFERKGKLQE